MSEPENPTPPNRKPVVFKSKKQIKEQWAKLDLSELENPTPPSEEHTALSELYQDDLHGLGNE